MLNCFELRPCSTSILWQSNSNNPSATPNNKYTSVISVQLVIKAKCEDDKSLNILFLSDDGRQAAIYIGSHKTSKLKGCQKISLNEFFIHHINRYITKHSPLLLHQSKSPSHTYVFVVRHTHIHIVPFNLDFPSVGMYYIDGLSFEKAPIKGGVKDHGTIL